MAPVKPPDSANRFQDSENAGWKTCRVCGSREFKGIVYFDSGSVAPAVAETVTGATTGDTGVIEKVYLRSGTYAGGDAAGCLELTSPTGYELENWTMFQDNENLNGSTSGANFATVNHVGSVVVNGVLYPLGDLVEYRGNYYCKPHFAWRFGHEWKTDNIFKSTMEKDREFS